MRTARKFLFGLLFMIMLAFVLCIPQASSSEGDIRSAIIANAARAETYSSHYLMGSSYGTEGEMPDDGTGWGGTYAGRWPAGESEIILLEDGVTAYAPTDGDSDRNPCIHMRCGFTMHFDCSGLVFWTYTNWNGYGFDTGLWVNRMRAIEYFTKCDEAGWSFTDLSLAENGDLLFNSDKSHVGIVTNSIDHVVVHASYSQVKVVSATYQVPSAYWTFAGDLVSTILEGVGGIVVHVDRSGLLAPYIGVASTILIATITTAVYFKRQKNKNNSRINKV